MSNVRDLAAGLSLVVLGLSAGPREGHAQASIEVIASRQRDGIDAQTQLRQLGIADDGAVAFAANTLLGSDRLLVSEVGSGPRDLGLSARTGGDVAINDDSIVYRAGAQIVGIARHVSTPVPSPLLDCSAPSGPCRGVPHIALARDGSVAIAAFDSFGGLYSARVSNGAPVAALSQLPTPGSFISALAIDVRSGGAVLVQGDHQGSNGEVYGAFRISPLKLAYRIDTAISTRVRGGSEAPVGAGFGKGAQVLALLPAQLDQLGTVVTLPALVSGVSQPYGTVEVHGTPLLGLLSVAGGSLAANDQGDAALVATLSSGWTGLFSVQTVPALGTPQPLVALGQQLGSCKDVPSTIRVLGNNDAGQVVALATVQTALGLDTQLWRVTPAPSLQTSFCPPRLRDPLPYPPIKPLPPPGGVCWFCR